MNELLKALKATEGRPLRFSKGELSCTDIDWGYVFWREPDFQAIANEIEAIVTRYFPDWTYIVFEYGVDYVHDKGLVWSIVNHSVYFDDDGDSIGDSYEMLDEIENHGKYPLLAEALIDTIYRGEKLDVTS